MQDFENFQPVHQLVGGEIDDSHAPPSQLTNELILGVIDEFVRRGASGIAPRSARAATVRERQLAGLLRFDHRIHTTGNIGGRAPCAGHALVAAAIRYSGQALPAHLAELEMSFDRFRGRAVELERFVGAEHVDRRMSDSARIHAAIPVDPRVACVSNQIELLEIGLDLGNHASDGSLAAVELLGDLDLRVPLQRERDDLSMHVAQRIEERVEQFVQRGGFFRRGIPGQNLPIPIGRGTRAPSDGLIETSRGAFFPRPAWAHFRTVIRVSRPHRLPQ